MGLLSLLQIYLPFAQTQECLLVLVGIGLCVGTLAGFFGVGGGWILTPALHLFGFPMNVAIGTGLAAMCAQSIVAVVRHYRMGNVEWRLAAVLIVSTLPGLGLGTWGVAELTRLHLVDQTVRGAYILLIGGLGLFMLLDSIRARASSTADKNPTARSCWAARLLSAKLPPRLRLARLSSEPVSLWPISAVGFVKGLIAGGLGAGGGFFQVPALIYALGLPPGVAVGTSLLDIGVSTGAGSFAYALHGSLDPIGAIWIILGSTIGAQIGVLASRHIPAARFRLLFACMLLLAAGAIGLRQMGFKTIAGPALLGTAACMSLVIVVLACLAARRDAVAR